MCCSSLGFLFFWLGIFLGAPAGLRPTASSPVCEVEFRKNPKNPKQTPSAPGAGASGGSVRSSACPVLLPAAPGRQGPPLRGTVLGKRPLPEVGRSLAYLWKAQGKRSARFLYEGAFKGHPLRCCLYCRYFFFCYHGDASKDLMLWTGSINVK